MFHPILLIALFLPLTSSFSPLSPSPQTTRLYSTLPTLPPNGKTLVVAGASGYIGKSVVQEGVRQGYSVISLVRSSSKARENKPLMSKLEGSTLVDCDPTVMSSLYGVLSGLGTIDSVICCLASRSGVKKDAYLVDYQASSNLLKTCEKVGARHFTLLSAFCCKNPWLQFQQAKLKVSVGRGKRDGGRFYCCSGDGNISYAELIYDVRPFKIGRAHV